MSMFEKELKDYDARGAWPIIYHKLRTEASLQHDFPMSVAKRADNKPLNRYRDVSPYDHSRVKLKKCKNDYINASLVQCPKVNRKYILAQGPLPNTSGHFWQMVWEQNTRAVLMLNKVIEKGMIKCAQYFPLGSINDGDDDLVFEDVRLKVSFMSAQETMCYTLRTFELQDMKTGVTKEILHFHFTTWPDFGVPPSPEDFLDFLDAVRESGALDANVGPAVIHCSAGIGRSGTFCLVDTCLLLVKQAGNLDSLDVRATLMEMRTYRIGLIQTHDQLRFSYLAILEGARSLLSNGAVDGIDGEIEKQSIQVPELEEPDIPPPLPPRRGNIDKQRNITENVDTVQEPENSETTIRQRKSREDRKKKTQEQIDKMREKQRASEIARRRRLWIKPYIKPILAGLGLAVLCGGYYFYKKYFIV
ncbi:unnamed protein product [Owenia fusiformis]|uniref:protein-tyrosine-phosphatase n=1 Tax=Owenia fusiformis TaxID=6347 RepID=A0A8J1Y8R2_OWEFU|nr:unnamed protein product [Owenia fusiformis]